MGLRREIEKMLERPGDSLPVRQVISFWAEHRKDSVTAAHVASALCRPAPQIEKLLIELADLGVLSRNDWGPNTIFRYRLSGSDAFTVEQFARSKSFHEQKLTRSADRFRAMYQRKSRE